MNSNESWRRTVARHFMFAVNVSERDSRRLYEDFAGTIINAKSH